MTNSDYQSTLSRLQAWYTDAAEAVQRGDAAGREILRDASSTYDLHGFRPIIADSGEGISMYGILMPVLSEEPGARGKEKKIQLSTDLGKIVRIAEEHMRAA